MLNITDQELIETYLKAVKLALDKDFIEMLKQELELRNLTVSDINLRIDTLET